MKHKSTGAATILSFFWPGLGQIYNGQILKGLFIGTWHLLMAFGTMAAMVTVPAALFVGGIINFIFWIVCMYDAHKMAELYNDGERVGQWRGTGKVFALSWGPIIGLALLGAFLGKYTSSGQAMLGHVSSGPVSSQQLPEDKAYLPNIRLDNLRAGEGYGKFDVEGISERKRGVYGTVRNLGDRTLKRVEVTVYFLDRNGQRIGESSYGAVSSYNFGGNTDPLKPGYVRDFGFTVEENAPKEWGGKFEAAVTDVDFEE